MSERLPLRSTRDKGVTFVLQHARLGFALAEDLLRVSLFFERDTLEVEVTPRDTLADTGRRLSRLDRELRMEIFSLTSEQEASQLIERQISRRALLISHFVRPWTEAQLLNHMLAFGTITELHCYPCRTGSSQQALAVFTDSDTRSDFIVAAQAHKQFRVRPLEHLDYHRDLLQAEIPSISKLLGSRTVSPSRDGSTSSNTSVCSADYFPYNISRTKLESISRLTLQLCERLNRTKTREAKLKLTSDSIEETLNRTASSQKSVHALTHRRKSLGTRDKHNKKCKPTILASLVSPTLDRSFLSASDDPRSHLNHPKQNPALLARHEQRHGPLRILPPNRAVPQMEWMDPSVFGPSSLGCRQAEQHQVNMSYKQAHISYFAFPTELLTQAYSRA